jgi:hypothetical protein
MSWAYQESSSLERNRPFRPLAETLSAEIIKPCPKGFCQVFSENESITALQEKSVGTSPDARAPFPGIWCVDRDPFGLVQHFARI